MDGNLSTRWSSVFTDPQWIYVDLGSTYNIQAVDLNWATAYGKAYQIQVSNDAVNWTTIYGTTTGTGGVNDLTGLSGTGRYVRMYGTVRGTSQGYSLWEFSVYGAPTTAFPTSPVLDNLDRTQDPLASGWTGPAWGDAGQFEANGTAAVSTEPQGTYSGSAWDTAYSLPIEEHVTISTLPSVSTDHVALDWLSSPTSSTPNGYYAYVTTGGSWLIGKVTSGGESTITSGSGLTLTVGDSIGVSISAAGVITLWHETGGVWSAVGSGTDTTYTGSGYLTMETNDTTVALDNFGGGTAGSGSGVPANPGAPTGSGSGLAVNQGAPSVSDTTNSGGWFVGDTLSATTGTWTNCSSCTYTYQWQNNSGKGFTNINGATCTNSGTGCPYTIETTDENDTLDVVVTATNSSGSSTLQASGATGTATTTGAAMPGAISGWKQVFADDFETPEPLGAFSGCTPQCSGLESTPYYNTWHFYDDGWTDDNFGTYYPSQSVSISNGILNYYIHTQTISGTSYNVIDTAVPQWGGGDGQLYGKYIVRARWDSIQGYHVAFLLWPEGTWPEDGEIDFPEQDFDNTSTTNFYMHHQGGTTGSDADSYSLANDGGNWHTYELDWTATGVSAYIDGKLVGDDTNTSLIPDTPMYWALETNTLTGNGLTPNGGSGHVQIAWAVAYTES